MKKEILYLFILLITIGCNNNKVNIQSNINKNEISHQNISDSITDFEELVLDSAPEIEIADTIFKNSTLKVGTSFPLYKLTDINGNVFDLKKIIGKPTIINFWFTTCTPCVAEIPILNDLKNEFKDSVNYISITFESKEKIDEFLDSIEFNYEIIVNAKEFIHSLGISSYPRNIFIDKNGIIINTEEIMPFKRNADGKLEMVNNGTFRQIIKDLL